MIFEYSYTQHMFSSATILVISTLIQEKGYESDLSHFKALSHFLSQLKSSGNFAAAEFCMHIDAIERLLSIHAAQQTDTGINQNATDSRNPIRSSLDFGAYSNEYYQHTASSATSGPPFPEFLLNETFSQPLSDLQFINESIYTSDLGLYSYDSLPNMI